MYKFNKNDIRDLYMAVKKDGLYYTTSKFEGRYHRTPESGIHAHIRPTMKRTLDFLKDIRKIDGLWKEVMVGSGSVNNGESWGDFYDAFTTNDEELKRLFNKLQEETSFGFYVEL